MIGLVVYLHYQLAVKCMSLVSSAPAMVSHILGVHDHDRHGNAHTEVLGGMVNFTRSGGQSLAAGMAPKRKAQGGEENDTPKVPVAGGAAGGLKSSE